MSCGAVKAKIDEKGGSISDHTLEAKLDHYIEEARQQIVSNQIAIKRALSGPSFWPNIKTFLIFL